MNSKSIEPLLPSTSGFKKTHNPEKHPKQQKKRYNILVAKGTNILDLDADMNLKRVKFYDQDFISVSLTDEQAKIVADKVKANGGIIEDDLVITLPPVIYYTPEEIKKNQSTFAINPTVAPGVAPITPVFITGIPKFAGTLKNQDVAVMDTQVYPTSPILKNYKVKVLGTVGTPCHPHGTNVSEVIAQMFNPKKTDMQILNFPTFNCQGKATLDAMATSIEQIITYKQGPGKNRGLTVNFSGAVVPSSSIVNEFFKRLVDAGIPLIVGAGNNGQSCAIASPASLSATSAVISVGGTQGQEKRPSSNYATSESPCVDIYLPACLPMTDMRTGEKGTGCGTSFSSPLQAGRVMVYQQIYNKKPPNTNLQNMKLDISKNTVTVPSGDIDINSVTDALAFAWPSRKPPKRK